MRPPIWLPILGAAVREKMKLEFSIRVAKREEHEYKRVCVRRLINLCSCAQISRLEEVLVDWSVHYQMDQSTPKITHFLLGKIVD